MESDGYASATPRRRHRRRPAAPIDWAVEVNRPQWAGLQASTKINIRHFFSTKLIGLSMFHCRKHGRYATSRSPSTFVDTKACGMPPSEPDMASCCVRCRRPRHPLNLQRASAVPLVIASIV